METGDLNKAYEATAKDHEQWIDIWGDEGTYAEAHGEFGTELASEFGVDKTFISVTTDPEAAEYFARSGTVYSGRVPKSELVEQTLDGAGESEWLIRSGTDALKPLK